MTPTIMDLPECHQFDTFEGIQFVFETDPLNDLAYSNPKIQVRRASGLPVVKEFKTGDGSMVIEQPYTIIIPEQIVSIPPGTYLWDLRVRFMDQRTITIFKGKWIIHPVITRL